MKTIDACTSVPGLTARRVLDGVYHIQDALGVCCTLLVGSERALLFDTGYGLFDLPGLVRQLTALPLRVVLSHGHFDHACGAAQFAEAEIHSADQCVIHDYTQPEQRQRVLAQAEAAGVLPSGIDRGAYMGAGAGNCRPLEEGEFDLGGLTVRVIHMPGHTPGSAGLWIEPHRLLLPGDNWNPTTWVFFPECEQMPQYIQTMRDLMLLAPKCVLSPHAIQMFPRERFERYVAGLTDQTLRAAIHVRMAGFASIRTALCHPEPETTLVFDLDKLA